MAVSSFIPTIWAAQLEKALQAKKVSQFFVNHNYEGEVIGAGSVKINRLADVSISDYDGNEIDVEDVNLSAVTLNIDSEKYFAVKVDDVDKVQARADMLLPLIENGAERLAQASDKANFEEMANNGTTISVDEITDADSAKKFVLQMKTKADENNVPSEGRVMAVPFAIENYLLSDSTINLASPIDNGPIKVGYVGKLYGIEIYGTNNLPEDTAILTTPAFTTEATQLTNIEAIRSEKSFNDIVRGLQVSGRKVTNSKGVIVANFS